MKLKKSYIIGILLVVIFILIYRNLNVGRVEVNNKISESTSIPNMEFVRNHIYKEKGILFILIVIGDGYSGTTINIMKMGKFYNLYIDDYTDSIDDEKENTYKILKKEIILDKETYKVGDSIFGKVKLEVSENNDTPYTFDNDIIGVIR